MEVQVMSIKEVKYANSMQIGFQINKCFSFTYQFMFFFNYTIQSMAMQISETADDILTNC